jgi:hypothetical protein
MAVVTGDESAPEIARGGISGVRAKCCLYTLRAEPVHVPINHLGANGRSTQPLHLLAVVLLFCVASSVMMVSGVAKVLVVAIVFFEISCKMQNRRNTCFLGRGLR